MKLAFFEEAVKHIERYRRPAKWLRRPFRPTACCWMMRGLRSSRSTTSQWASVSMGQMPPMAIWGPMRREAWFSLWPEAGPRPDDREGPQCVGAQPSLLETTHVRRDRQVKQNRRTGRSLGWHRVRDQMIGTRWLTAKCPVAPLQDEAG